MVFIHWSSLDVIVVLNYTKKDAFTLIQKQLSKTAICMDTTWLMNMLVL